MAAIVGGAKVSTKLDLLGNLSPRSTSLVIGGGMANTFLLAQGKHVGKSLAEHDLCRDRARHHRQGRGRQAARSCCRSMPWWRSNSRRMRRRAPSASTRSADDDMILDVGPRIDRARDHGARRGAKTLVWNGPFGAFEMQPFDTGTVEVAEARGGTDARPASSSRSPAAATRSRRSTRAGVAGRLHLRFDRRRRVSGMAGRQGAAGRRVLRVK